MNLPLAFIVLAFLSTETRPILAQVPWSVFATHAGGASFDLGTGVATDSMGNAFLTGYFIGAGTFGTAVLMGPGQEDIFVAKYDPTGSVLWAVQAGGTNDDIGEGVAVDAAGSCYVTGSFSGNASFGSTNLVGSTAPTSSDIFVAKYDGSGNLLWVTQAGGDRDNGGLGIAVDTNGNSYVTGYYKGSATFGNVTLPATGTSANANIFLAKYDAGGNVLWATYAGGDQDDVGEALVIDSQGNICLTGYLGAPGDIPSMYLAKRDGNGSTIWATGASRTGLSIGLGIAADAAGNLLVCGEFKGMVTFGGSTLSSQGYEDAFLAKYNTDGQLLWIRQLGGINSSAGAHSTATDCSGNCFVTGYFTDRLSTDVTNLISSGLQDGFIAKYDAAGNLLWILQVGGGEWNAANGATWRSGKGLYVTGAFSLQATIGGTVLNSYGSADVFLARIEERPIVTIMNFGGNALISWPTNQLGFTLEKATNSLPASQWFVVTNVVSVSGDHYVVTDQLSGSSSFYRLTKP
jgi:hypothetical protein